MLRFQHVFASALAPLLVLPGLAPRGDQDGIDLDARIAATARAIEELGSLAERLRSGDRAAVVGVLAATEAAGTDARTRDATVESLRREVATLYERVDGVAEGRGDPGGEQPTEDRVTGDEGATPAVPVAVSTRGLGPTEREALRRRPQIAPGPGRTDDPARRGTRPARAFEDDPSYSADAVRQARLSLRMGRAPEAIGLLAPHTADPHARYWLARSYEAAGLHDEAIRHYDALANDPDGGSHGARAALDRDFLRVKRELAGRPRPSPPATDSSEENE